MRTSVRKELDRIDRFLARNNQASRDLWAVLTALRGPDRLEDGQYKTVTTGYVRTLAFPVTAKLDRGEGSILPATFATPKGRKKLVIQTNVLPYKHFFDHVRRAKMAFERRDK